MSIRNLLGPAWGRTAPVTVVAVLAVAALLVAGCGAKSDSPGVATATGSGGQAGATTTTAANRERQLLDFTRCMREHGVNLPDPVVDANGNVRLQPPTGSQPSQATLNAARDACGKYLQGAIQGFAGQNQSQFRDTLLKYTQCMRKNGYDMPDPVFSDQGITSGDPFGPGVDRNDPSFQKANEACASYLAQLFGGGGS
jgi:hypothetical protein